VRVLLIGNYAPDRQESMLRYASMLREGLLEAGHDVTVAAPEPVLNYSRRPAQGVWKWVGYLDKFVLNQHALARAASEADVVHVCDHSNAVYVPGGSRKPYVVTCHDLLAVRGALGEDTDCPATFAGRQLQKSILSGLGRADAVACVSGATLRDAQRLLGSYRGKLVITPNPLNYPYRKLDGAAVRERFARAGVPVSSLENGTPYVLHVGSNLRRKNRECALRAVAHIASSWKGRLVFAGQPLSAELRALASELGVMDRVIEVAKPSNELLEALYNGALALLFPSRFEGFGWPIVEAQACGCPVLCSRIEPFPEVSGKAAILCDADDHEAFGRAILELASNAAHRAELVRAGFANSARYDRALMIGRFVALYEQVTGRASAAA
jgi:glycosyltransferase involved in cell wall biosynthesis